MEILIFLGRADNQVKVRGYRLELQEIEHELSRLPGIEDCTVIMIQSVDREKELAAYFVAGNTLQPGPLRKSYAGTAALLCGAYALHAACCAAADD
ncbi:hypothetical protein ACFTAO_23035 [Paenibacillus rhizoplanae]